MFPLKDIQQIRVVESIRIGSVGAKISSGAGSGAVSPAIPKIAERLKIFEPIILLNAISLRRCSTLAKTAIISGKDVPTAIMVNPMTVWLRPRARARFTPPSTNRSAPMIRPMTPPIQYKLARQTVRGLSLSLPILSDGLQR